MFFINKAYLYFILLFYKIICGYNDAMYIKEYTDVHEMIKKIESDNKTAFFLIYSDLCPHCLIFEPYYIKLSEEYHERVKFYVMDLYTNWDDKFDIKGTPTLFIYHNGKFKEYQDKRKYEVLKELLDNELLRTCKDLEYEKIDEFKEKFNNNKNESNYIIGYFKNEEDTKNFKNSIKNFLEDIDYCYIVNVFPQNVIEKNIEIMSKQQGNNSFDEFIFEGFNEQTNLDFEIFIKENIFNIFYEIDNKENLNYFKKNDKKNFFIFVYETEDEKNNYIEKIKSLKNFTKNKEIQKVFYVIINKKKLNFDKGIFLLKSKNELKNKIEIKFDELEKEIQNLYDSEELSEDQQTLINQEEIKKKNKNKKFVNREEIFIKKVIIICIIIIIILFILIIALRIYNKRNLNDYKIVNTNSSIQK